MGLAQEWLRQVRRAWGVAAAVPLALIAAIAVISLTGGFGHLGSLGQVLSGPSLGSPSGALSGGGASLALARGETRLFRSEIRVTGSAVSHASAGRGSASGGAVVVNHPGTSGAGSSPGGGSGGSGGSAGAGGSGSAGGSGGGGSGGGGGGGSGLTGQISKAVGAVTDTAAGVAAGLPGPVGSTASQTIQQVGGTVQGAIPGGSGTQIRILP